MSEKLWYLKDCRLFERLSSEDLARLEAVSRVRRFPKGSPVYLPVDSYQAIMLVAQGQVKICSVHRDGRQSIQCFVNPGEIFGELALVGVEDRDEYAETTEASTIVLMPRTIMEELLLANPGLTLGITRLVGLRKRKIERRLKNLLFQSNRQRLIHLLLELAEDYGRRVPNDQIELGVRLSHQDLASIIGSTRESVTLLLGKMQEEGLVRVQRRRITVCSLPRLMASVDRPTAPSLVPPRKASSTSANTRITK
jgi:CRP-like cAMP-binding protein